MRNGRDVAVPCGRIAVLERIDQAVAGEAGHRLLPGFGPVGGTFAEGVALDRPALVGLALEILEDRGHVTEIAGLRGATWRRW